MIKPIIGRMIPPRFPSDDKVSFGNPVVLVVDKKGNYIQINVDKDEPTLISVAIREHKFDKIV